MTEIKEDWDDEKMTEHFKIQTPATNTMLGFLNQNFEVCRILQLLIRLQNPAL